MRTKKLLTADELLDLFNSQWATTKDIMNIGVVGMNKALFIKKEIMTDLISKGYMLPNGLVPMSYVIDYFKININYLKKVARK